MRQDIPQDVIGKKSLKNPHNQIIADKFLFFGNSLDFVCYATGEFHQYEVENHISLINHLVFIADSTMIYPERTYIKNGFLQIKEVCRTHPLFSKNDLFLTERDEKVRKKTFSLLKKIEDESELGTKDTEVWLNRIRNIKGYLLGVKKILDVDYFKAIIASLSIKIGCKHSLQFHRQHFEYIARLVFSYYYLNGYSRNMINTFMRKSLDNRISNDGHNIYTQAFIPKELYDRLIHNNVYGNEFDKVLFNEIKDYLENRGTKGQIDSLFHRLHYKQHEHHLIFRLEGLIISPDEEEKELNILGLKISRIDDFKERHSNFNYELTKDFFSNERYSALVEVKVDAFDQDDAVYAALEQLEKKLGKIMRVTNSRFNINRKYYTHFPQFERAFFVNPIPEMPTIGKYSLEELVSYEKRLFKLSHRELYYELEDILQKGYLEDNVSSSIHFYRKFIEILHKRIPDCGIDNVEGMPSEVRTIAYLFAYFEKRRYRNKILRFAHNKLLNMDLFNVDRNTPSKIYHSKVRETGFLLPFHETLKYMGGELEHTKYEMRRAMNYPISINQKQVFDYYVRQLLFIKQYRDKHQHANITDYLIERKLGVCTYRILNQLLQNIFSELGKKSNKKKSSGRILQELVLSSKKAVD